jgi:hypothetical protein
VTAVVPLADTAARVRSVLRHLWASGQLRCVLAAAGDPPFLVVQLRSHETTLYSQRVKEPADAVAVAADLWSSFVKDGTNGSHQDPTCPKCDGRQSKRVPFPRQREAPPVYSCMDCGYVWRQRTFKASRPS